jgi:hypothetical protein
MVSKVTTASKVTCNNVSTIILAPTVATCSDNNPSHAGCLVPRRNAMDKGRLHKGGLRSR